MANNNQQILLIGCGKMGSALLGGFIESGITANNITVVEPNNTESIQKSYAVNVFTTMSELQNTSPDIVIFAVKPQILDDVLAEFVSLNIQNALLISIAAGKTISFFEKHLGKNRPIIRTMPNLCALIGQAAIGGVSNDHVSDEQKQQITHLFSGVGDFFWVDEEKQMDSITAISGSGPAYLFHFIEALSAAGKDIGLDEELATSLAYSTIVGSTNMAKESKQTATELREQVTSPNGTTAAALEVLMNNTPNLSTLVRDAAKAAKERSKELAD